MTFSVFPTTWTDAFCTGRLKIGIHMTCAVYPCCEGFALCFMQCSTCKEEREAFFCLLFAAIPCFSSLFLTSKTPGTAWRIAGRPGRCRSRATCRDSLARQAGLLCMDSLNEDAGCRYYLLFKRVHLHACAGETGGATQLWVGLGGRSRVRGGHTVTVTWWTCLLLPATFPPPPVPNSPALSGEDTSHFWRSSLLPAAWT